MIVFEVSESGNLIVIGAFKSGNLIWKPSLKRWYVLLKAAYLGESLQHERDSAPGSTVGTPAYLAPEVIRASEKDPYDAKVTSSD